MVKNNIVSTPSPQPSVFFCFPFFPVGARQGKETLSLGERDSVRGKATQKIPSPLGLHPHEEEKGKKGVGFS